jgi:hypothetical protein
LAPSAGFWFFDDGRRALVDVRCGCQAGVVDAETGKPLFTFAPDPGSTGSLLVRPVGNQVLSAEYRAGTSSTTLHLWERRYPEGWKGHLLRPEVLGAVLLGAAMVVLWSNRPRHEDSDPAVRG